MVRRIDSPSNPLVKSVAALKDRRARERSDTFLIEGQREGWRALAAGLEPLMLLHAPGLFGSGAARQELLEAASSQAQEAFELSDAAFKRLSVRQNPDGFAFVARRPPRDLGRLPNLDGRLVLVLDGLEKPGNVGALLRTADAAGVAAVIVSGPGTDLENPNVVRASQGSVFSVPLAIADDDAAAALLRGSGHRLVAATPHAEAAHWEADYRGAVAVLVGAEDSGLSQRWLDLADVLVRIPMRAGGADSLNVSAAAAVILFEAVRQRGSGAADGA